MNTYMFKFWLRVVIAFAITVAVQITFNTHPTVLLLFAQAVLCTVLTFVINNPKRL